MELLNLRLEESYEEREEEMVQEITICCTKFVVCLCIDSLHTNYY